MKIPADNIEIVPLTFSHLSQVLKIEKETFPDPWTTEAFVEVVAEGYPSWAALMRGIVAGYAVTQSILDELHLLNIAVAEPYRKNGIGSQILSYILKRAEEKDAKDVFLEVRVSNASAIALYHRFDFQELSLRPRYYRNGEDAWVMHLRLGKKATSAGGSVEEMKDRAR